MGNIKITPADKVFSQWIRLRDKECRRCHSTVEFNSRGLPVTHQASHFKGRGKQGTRFEPLNVDTLCYGCHAYLGAQPDEHLAWQISMKGQAMVDRLILASNTYHKKQYDLEKIYWSNKLKEDYGV